MLIFTPIDHPVLNWRERETYSHDFKTAHILFIYLFIMLCQFHTIISAQIQTQEIYKLSINQSINGRVYATALRRLQQPLA